MPWNFASALLDRLVRDSDLERDRDRRERIQHVVQPGQVQVTGSVRPSVARVTSKCVRRPSRRTFSARTSALFAEAVADDRTIHLRRMLLDVRVVAAEHREPVERQVVQELDEALLEPPEVAVVRAEMIVVDVRDDRDHRLQVQERRVALVGLGDEILAGAEPRIACRRSRAGRRSRTWDPRRPRRASHAIRLVVVVLPCVPAIAMP